MKYFFIITFLIVLTSIVTVIINFRPPKHLKPNVVIIVMDTVRPDHLSCYGYTKKTSPNLDTLVKDSRIYYNAYSTSCWTSVAHASLFTGLFPVAHKTSQEHWIMSDQLTTLAEIFSAQGYETIGIVENPMLGKQYNFNQGFSLYYETWKKDLATLLHTMISRENTAFSLFKRSLRKRDKAHPFFMFINFIEPHSPYDSSQQFYDQFLTDTSLTCNSNEWRDYFLKRIHFTPDELRHLHELYDAEILYVDYYIGKIIAELKRKDLWENTIFIVTSDHGENIGDHDMMDHQFCLYESTIKIPLIIHYTKSIPIHSEDHSIVQLPDIFPTLLNLTGLTTENYYFQGQDLFTDNSERRNMAFCEYYYPELALQCFRKKDRKNKNLWKYKRKLKSLLHNNMKLIWASDGNHELYDLENDPDEKNNLFTKKEYHTIGQRMMQTIEDTVDEYTTPLSTLSATVVQETIDKESIDALKTLGYMNAEN